MRQALCLQMNVPYLDLTRLQIDPSLARLINRTYAVRNVVVPVSQVGQTLTVAMNDPSDLEAAEDLAQSTGCIIRVVTSSRRAIQDAITRLYSPSANAAEIDALESLELVQDTEDHAIGKEYTAQSRRADDIVRQIFNIAISRGCSDVHMEPLSRNRLHIRFRIDGVLRELDLGHAAAGVQRERAVDRVARQDPGQARYLGAAPSAGRQLPPARRGAVGRHARLRSPRVGDAELLRRERGGPHPRPPTRAQVDRQPEVRVVGDRAVEAAALAHVGHRPHHRPHGFGQEHHALRGAAEHLPARNPRADRRGSRSSTSTSSSASRKSTSASATRSPATCAPFCATIRK